MQMITKIGLDIAKSVFQVHGVVGTAPHQGRGHRTCQQDCAHGLGHDGQGRALQATRRAGRVNEIAPVNRRDVKVGRANST